MNTTTHDSSYTDCYKEEYHLLDMRWLDDKLPENEGFQLRDTMQSLSADFQKVSLVILQALAMALVVSFLY
ncbi:hypothetical protein U1Q18_051361 [Sarracenia purpurea var. burkii]